MDGDLSNFDSSHGATVARVAAAAATTLHIVWIERKEVNYYTVHRD